MSGLAALLLFASVPTSPPPAAPLVATPSTGTLIVFRDHAEPLLFPAALAIGGVEVGRLRQKRLLAFAVPPGRHQVTVRWPALAMQKSASATVTLAAGETVYLELRAASAFAGMRGGAGLLVHGAEAGAAALRCCRQ